MIVLSFLTNKQIDANTRIPLNIHCSKSLDFNSPLSKIKCYTYDMLCVFAIFLQYVQRNKL